MRLPLGKRERDQVSQPRVGLQFRVPRDAFALTHQDAST